MSSFKDQLLKTGLIDSKKAKKAALEKRKAQKLQKQSKKVVVDEVKEAAEKAQKDKVANDRKLNQQRKEAAEEKAVAAQIKQLIEMNRQPKSDSDEAVGYNFTDGKSVKKIHVSAATQDLLVRGRLAIVRLGNDYELVPSVVADKISQRDDLIVLSQQETSAETEEDEYKDYQIPDDLMW